MSPCPLHFDTSWFSRLLSSADVAQAMVAAVQARADTLSVSLRTPPPLPTTCCGRGCNGCVWEGYYAAVEYWREQARAQLCRADAASRSAP